MLELIEKPGFVYCWINQTKGKAYIGSHWGGHLDDGYIGSGVLFKRAVKKYGLENFIRFPLHIYKSIPKKYLHKEEQFWINHFHQKWSHGIYNISLVAGGGYQLDNATLEKKIECNTKISNKSKNRIVSSETKQKQSLVRKGKKLGSYHKQQLVYGWSKRRLNPVTDITKNKLKVPNSIEHNLAVKKSWENRKKNLNVIRPGTKRVAFDSFMKVWVITPFGSFINYLEAEKYNQDKFTGASIRNFCKQNINGYSIRKIK